MINTAAELFTSTLDYSYKGEETLEEAKNRFASLQADGIIKPNCTFDSNSWFTTDEYANIGLHFKFNIFNYGVSYKPILGMPYDLFLNCVKAYMVSVFGRNALTTMHTLLLDLRHIINTPVNDVYSTSATLRIASPMLCFDFFISLPISEENDELDRLLAALDNFVEKQIIVDGRNQRDLADFDSYFVFNDIIKEFWISTTDVNTKLFFFPLWLWWEFTAILPLRPREFLLTERDCLTKDSNGDYYLRIRRNNIKGKDKPITYRISDDYITEVHKITKRLGDEIQNYIDLTSQFGDTELKTLFVMDPHYAKWGRSKAWNNRYLTYTNMNTIIKTFYKEVIVKQHHLRVRYDHPDEHLADDEICYIHLGDTRHIAIINMLQEGVDLVTAALLAGHDNVNTTSHYASNTKKFIECKVYRYSRKLLHSKDMYALIPNFASFNFAPIKGTKSKLADGGYCMSDAFAKGSIEDCLKSSGKNGEIGYCRSCLFYRQDSAADEDIYSKNLKDDCDALAAAIDVVRKGNGDIECIGEALLRVRASSSSYEAYLTWKKAKEMEES